MPPCVLHHATFRIGIQRYQNEEVPALCGQIQQKNLRSPQLNFSFQYTHKPRVCVCTSVLFHQHSSVAGMRLYFGNKRKRPNNFHRPSQPLLSLVLGLRMLVLAPLPSSVSTNPLLMNAASLRQLKQVEIWTPWCDVVRRSFRHSPECNHTVLPWLPLGQSSFEEPVPCLITGTGRRQTVTLTTNTGDVITIGENNPMRFAEGAAADGIALPYATVRGGLEARIARAVFPDLVEAGSVADHEGDEWFGVWSSGSFWPMMRADEACA